MEEDPDVILLQVFLEETFHTTEPIREKPIQTSIDRVWIKDRRHKYVTHNGVRVKSEEPVLKPTLNQRFQDLQSQRQAAGVVFETDPTVGDDEDFEDVDDEDEEDLSTGPTAMARKNRRKQMVTIAQKLKKRAIANRLGVSYMPGHNRLRPTLAAANRPVAKKSWAEKFGRLLAAKKLLYLPLLLRKYNTGPRKTRQELDMELDLYMSEIKGPKMQLAFNDITNAVNNGGDINRGFNVVDTKELLSGIGGKGWRKKIKEQPAPEVVKEVLDMEIDSYMAGKDKQQREPIVFSVEEMDTKEGLDIDLDEYMAVVRKKAPPKTLMNGMT